MNDDIAKITLSQKCKDIFELTIKSDKNTKELFKQGVEEAFISARGENWRSDVPAETMIKVAKRVRTLCYDLVKDRFHKGTFNNYFVIAKRSLINRITMDLAQNTTEPVLQSARAELKHIKQANGTFAFVSENMIVEYLPYETAIIKAISNAQKKAEAEALRDAAIANQYDIVDNKFPSIQKAIKAGNIEQWFNDTLKVLAGLDSIPAVKNLLVEHSKNNEQAAFLLEVIAKAKKLKHLELDEAA